MFNMFKPFTRPRSEVIWLLETVLHGKMDCRAWDTFISIPIKGDPEMEAIRQACEDLAQEEIIENDGTLHHKPNARIKLEGVLSALTCSV
jgi:hypothetical protein